MEKEIVFMWGIGVVAFYILLCSGGVLCHPGDSSLSILGLGNLSSWRIQSSNFEAPGPTRDPITLLLAENRTRRPDILSKFHKYQGGWDVANKHYWNSVGSTGGVAFIAAALWFISFALVIVIHYFCTCKIKIRGKESIWWPRICLLLLTVFTISAVVGSILISLGQKKFHGEALSTLNYVVNQSEYTVHTLRNVTGYLSLAETISVAQIFLPSDVKDDIDRLTVNLNTAADNLALKTNENSSQVQKVFNAVKSSLIGVATVFLFVSVLGLVVSVPGYQQATYIFIILGWLLVSVSLVLCGIFTILNNVVKDTCIAMGEWVENPQAETALSSILPCVDQETTNQTLFKSKQVINDVVNIVNGFTGSIANSNPPPWTNSTGFYNQSGPLIPPLCYPYDSLLQDRTCSQSEISIENATLVWQNYTCTVSETDRCNNTGRLIPSMYMELVAAVNVSYALKHYTPPLMNLENCNFVRDSVTNITTSHCPSLERHLRTLNTGLGLVSGGVMLSLALWLIYANRPPRGGSV